MIRNLIIHYDYSSSPVEVYELKRYLMQNGVEYNEVNYRNEKEVKDFYNNLTTTNITYMRDNGITVGVPLQTIVMMCVVVPPNSFVMRSGKQAIIDFISQNLN